MNTARLKRVAARYWFLPGILFGGFIVAMGIQEAPIAITGLICLVLFVVALLFYVPRLPKLFLSALGVLLVIYAFLGRGGAYIGVPPLFVSEICLALGIFSFVFSSPFRHIQRIPVVWLLLTYIALGAVRTLPYVGQYGIVALRDAVIWGYAVFAVIVSGCLLRTGWIEKAVRSYGSIVPWFIAWVPVAYVLEKNAIVPKFPLSGQRLLDYKPGDMLVHLAGTAGFILAGLYAARRHHRNRRAWLQEWPLWLVWMLGFALTATRNRGGMLAAVLALLTVLVLKPTERWGRILLIGVVLLSVSLMFNASLGQMGGREVSFTQLKENIESIYSDDTEGALSGTREWRLEWWSRIIDYTFNGPYFWTGRGFGMTLFTDISPGGEDADLRSPHNYHMTVLARMGVPGFALWVTLNVIFVFTLLTRYFKARALGREFWARLNVWLLMYWVAFVINASFDVYLEGPQGAIWFWSLFGMAIAVVRTQDLEMATNERGRAAAAPPPRPRPAASG